MVLSLVEQGNMLYWAVRFQRWWGPLALECELWREEGGGFNRLR